MDYSKTTVIRLWHRKGGARASFDLLIYGYTADELLTVPNPVIQGLATRYPDYVASPFGIETLHGKKPVAPRVRKR